MKKLKRFDQINVIPFIDIMLVLLVMVLTTATFIKQGIIPVDLPKAQQEEKEKELEELTIYITKAGKLFVDKEEVASGDLKARLSSLSPDQTVVLRSDKEATFQQFVTVMDILKELKHEQLYIVTKQQ
ncbi:MAG: biopolymer transporter ExbD [Sulfurimonadaceae bacterium]|nr:biopolymer transporter ExbD [Sulfurimonadaceae bacterium]